MSRVDVTDGTGDASGTAQADRRSSRLALFAVLALSLLGAGLRLAYFAYSRRAGGLEWVDPDHYLWSAAQLVSRGTWCWTIEAVRHAGSFFKAPLYAVMLSLLGTDSSSSLWLVAIAHALLAGIGVAAVWSVARDLHSARAGILAAALFAVYLPVVATANVVMQEQLYQPLLLVALAVLMRAVVLRAGVAAFAAAGAALGVAALARSMPAFFVVPAALLLIFLDADRRRGARDALAFAGAFAAVVIPYSVFISLQTGRMMLVENVGGYGLARLTAHGRVYFGGSEDAPTTAQLVGFLAHRLWLNPPGFLAENAERLWSMFKFGGGRWLDSHAVLPSAFGATCAEWAAHVLADGLLALGVLAAPFGMVVARRRRAVSLLVLWIAVHLGVSAVSGYAGQRFRGVVDPLLFVLAACVVSGSWRRPSRATVAGAAIAALVLAWPLAKSLPDSAAGRADYGRSQWQLADGSKTAVVSTAAGFTARTIRGTVSFGLKTAMGAESARLDVLVDGHQLRRVIVGPSEAVLVIPYRRERAFVELRVDPPGTPIDIRLSEQ